MAALAVFFNKASKDARIGIAHIGLFVTLLQLLSEQDSEGPLVTYSGTVMQVAKISSSATYHKLMRELDAYGYIKYNPSYYKGRGSCIYLSPSQ
ncbi:hypothetical protein [Mucilaginibacter pineti]|uniref:hypothetical protein n=1 Tax=Mucilaginibacter pineti TaxID=1391627 RepID=UPI00115F9382|nr:hypothetical protein [Mucilaginibacter pineti]